ncbi:hypothetical protein ACIQ1J_14300 [Streptomyces sp. NPDC097107]|uniref:hypothetical protein n=1 Tax=Streptomyces sp. NPDC097107 TaxID=3366089 RepID=UPI003830D5A9
MGSSGDTGRGGALETYREVIDLTGPLLPVVSFLGRLPTATIQFGSVLLVARTSGSPAVAGLTGGALALGQVACGPLVGRLADRRGRRTVVLVGPALVGLAAILAHPAYALTGAAVLVAVCGTAFALHPTARAAATSAVGATGTPGGFRGRPRVPRAVHALRASLALRRAMFRACQAGLTALTERLGQPEQAGLVYAARGVMSAIAGLAMAVLPARVGLRARRWAATATACALSLLLLWTDGLTGLYVVVTVLGIARAPHLITVFALTSGRCRGPGSPRPWPSRPARSSAVRPSRSPSPAASPSPTARSRRPRRRV